VPSTGPDAKQSFANVRSQTEFGNEEYEANEENSTHLTDLFFKPTLPIETPAKEGFMDATRSRRTRDAARQRWYAACRNRRFARLLGFAPSTATRPRK
jgi:hypothetical protein